MYMEKETRALYIEEGKEIDYENNVYPLVRKISMDVMNRLNLKQKVKTHKIIIRMQQK